MWQKSSSDNVEWSSKRLQKMIPADIKADAKQEIKELAAASYHMPQKYLLETGNTLQNGLVFLI